MYQLIKKDLLIQKRTVFLSIFFLLFFALYFSDIGPAGLSISVLAVTYMLILGASAMEEKNNGDKMLISLPIKKDRIVLSKYLSVFVFAGLILLFNYLIGLLVDLIHLPLNTMSFTLTGVMGAIAATIFFCSISLPLIFKFGYLKSRFINFFLFFLIIFGGTALLDEMIQNNPFLTNFLMERSNTEMSLFILIPVFLIFLISYFLSLSFYKNREF